MTEELKPHRTLTDEDIEAITNKLRQELVKQFYHDVGRGAWKLLWQTFVALMLMIAAYGAVKSGGVQV